MIKIRDYEFKCNTIIKVKNKDNEDNSSKCPSCNEYYENLDVVKNSCEFMNRGFYCII